MRKGGVKKYMWYKATFGGLELESMPLPDAENGQENSISTFPLSIKDTDTAIASFGFLIGTYTNQREALFSVKLSGFDYIPVYCRWSSDSEIKDFQVQIASQMKEFKEDQAFSFAEFNKICDMSGKPVLNLEENKLIFSGHYSEAFMKNFSQSFELIQEQFSAKSRLNEIDIITQSQTEQLDSFNDNDVDYDRTQTLVSLFRKCASDTPEKTALKFRDKRFTYREIDETSDNIARYISRLGLGNGDVVAILIPRCEYMVIASFGALKARCAYQPLDSSYPAERLNFMVKDSGAKLLITTEELRPLLNEYEGNILYLKDVENLPRTDEKLPEPKPEDLFVLLYTSGSTGTPKGVKLMNSNLVCFVNWYKRYYGITPEDCAGVYASYGFDVCMMDMYSPLTAGASVCIIPEDIRMDLRATNKYLEDNNITHCSITTQVGRQFAVSIKNHSLKHLTVAGEKLVSLEPPTDYQLNNGYGPTECTILSNIYPVRKNEKNIPIGVPLDNLKLYIVDLDNRRVPAGALGELLITGPQVADGYLNRPEKTAQAFVKNPFGEGTAYRTGDVVRYRDDGNIEFLGRRDGQVKIRGFRIELTEVEGIIREFPGINDATVAAFDYPSGGKYIAAYVVSDKKIDISALNKFIADSKPPYMVPAVTMQIEKIPLNQNNKVDKRALPKPQHKSSVNVPPENETQQKIFDCIAQITGTKDFGITTDLFELGLTSIGIIQLNILLHEKFSDKEITILDQEAYKTVKTLEDFINNSAQAKTWEIRSEYPLTQTQESLLEFIELTNAQNTIVYNVKNLFSIDDRIDLAKLKNALETAVNAHPYIKAKFLKDDSGKTRVLRNDGLKPEVYMHEVETLPDYSEFMKPFELFGGNLYRIDIFSTKQGKYLYVDFHHLISDGESLKIFFEDVSRAYAGEDVAKETYTEFEAALDEEVRLGTDAYDKAKRHFKNLICNRNTDCLIPSDNAEISGCDTVSGASLTFKMSHELSDKIIAYCLDKKFTLNAFFSALYGFTLGKFISRNDVTFYTTWNGRSDPRMSRSFAMLASSFPVCCDLKEGTKIHDYVSSTGKQISNSMAGNIYPFSNVIKELGYDISKNTMFIYHGELSESVNEICGYHASKEGEGISVAIIPVLMKISLNEGVFSATFEYMAALYSEDTLRKFFESFTKYAGVFSVEGSAI